MLRTSNKKKMGNKFIYILGSFFIFFTLVMTINLMDDMSKKQVKQEESVSQEQQIGGEKDEHGCLVGAGYSWCEQKNKCLRLWEEGCDVITTVLADLGNYVSVTFSQLSETSFEWKGGSSGDVDVTVVGSSKTATAATSDLNYELDHFFQSNGYIEDQFNFLDETLPARGYQKGNIVCLVSNKKTDKDNPEALNKQDPYDFIVKCGELEKENL
jgi:hypothetical protein